MILQLIPQVDVLFEMACRYGLDTRILRLFIEHPSIDLGRDNNLSLRNACVCGNLDNIRLLLAADTRPDIMVDYSQLFVAAGQYTGDDRRHISKILKVLLRDKRIYYNTNVCKQILCAIVRILFCCDPDARRMIRRWGLALGILSPDQVEAGVTPFLFKRGGCDHPEVPS